jgi:hypothetical protein
MKKFFKFALVALAVAAVAFACKKPEDKPIDEPTGKTDWGGAWGVIGDFNGWAGDVEMNEIKDGWYEAEIEIAGGTLEFKFRRDKTWGDYEYGLPEAGEVALDQEIALKEKGGNLKVPKPGIYTVQLQPNKELAKVHFVSEPFVPAIKIDGDISDWEGIDAQTSSQTSRIREWKFKSDARYVYFLFKIRKNRAYHKPLVIGFDTDNNEETGTSYDSGKINGMEAQVEAYPFTNASSGVEPEVVSGVDPDSWAKAGSEKTEKVVTVAGYDAGEDVGTDASNTYIEISIPRSALNLTSGATISIGCAFDWYITGKQSLTVE